MLLSKVGRQACLPQFRWLEYVLRLPLRCHTAPVRPALASLAVVRLRGLLDVDGRNVVGQEDESRGR